MPGDERTKATDMLFPFLVILVAFGVYASSPVYQSSDSRYTLHLAASIVQEGNINLDEYGDQIPYGDYRIRHIDGHVYPLFPVGVPLLTTPFVWLYRSVSSLIDISFGELSLKYETVVASFFTSACILVYYVICRKYLSVKKSVFLAFVYAFATPAWSTASRALWQHGPSMLMLCLTLYVILQAEDRPWLIQFASLPLAYSFVIRPTNSISVVLLSVFVFYSYRKYFLGYLGLSLVIAIPFLLLNVATYHSLFSPYYAPGRIGSSARFFQAVAGNLISPARGLLVFSPVLLLSVPGVVLKAQDRRLGRLDVTLMAIIVLHLLAVSSLPHWWGGHSFGPRFLTDVVPYLMYLLIPAVEALTKPTGAQAWACTLCVGLLTACSVLIHFSGATNQATYAWNSEPVSVDRHPERLWDWGDLQFLRGISAFDPFIAPRMMVKPERVLILRQSDAQDSQEAHLELVNLRYRDFGWEAILPPGLDVFPRHGEGATHTSLRITVPETAYPPGRHELGAIEVTVRSGGRFSVQGDVVSVPVELYVVDTVYSAFMPVSAR